MSFLNRRSVIFKIGKENSLIKKIQNQLTLIKRGKRKSGIEFFILTANSLLITKQVIEKKQLKFNTNLSFSEYFQGILSPGKILKTQFGIEYKLVIVN